MLFPMNHETAVYASYLVRLWRDDNPATAVYHAEVEHIQTGQRRQFQTPDDLWAFLNQAIPTTDSARLRSAANK
jgi:hypothetical protein